MISSSGVTDGDYLVMDSSGNVGISSVSPNARVDVVGAGATSATSPLHVHNSAFSDAFIVLDDGNVLLRRAMDANILMGIKTFLNRISSDPFRRNH